MSPTPLPELERELHEAARRLEGAGARRWWRHGWVLVAAALAMGGGGVAVAKVAGVDTFAYLGSIAEHNPKLAPVSLLTLTDNPQEPRWMARALVNRLGQLCITGGPADPRTDPDAKPTSHHLNNPPQVGMTCADSDESAETLIDPTYPGGSFGSHAPLAGGTNTPTHILVYAVTAEPGPALRVRWGDDGPLTPMRVAAGRLHLKVDKSPDGLSAAAQQQVSRYPDELTLKLWAADVAVPAGERLPQVLSSDLPGASYSNSVIEVVGEGELNRRIKAVERSGRQPIHHIERAPRPVRGVIPSQRRWIGAFARRRTIADAVPPSEIDVRLLRERVQPAATRRLTVAGDGLGPVWIAPAGLPEFLPDRQANDSVCVLGAAVIDQCKNGSRSWKRPMVEAVVCARGLDPDETLVWALTPPGAVTFGVVGPGAVEPPRPAKDLIVIRGPRGQRITAIEWQLATGPPIRVKVPWPREGLPRCGGGRNQYRDLRRDSEGSSSSGRGY